MKIVQILGHNPNWNIETFTQQSIGDEFLITAFSFGSKFVDNKRVAPVLDKSMLDLQFYGQKNSASLSKGKLSDFDFHPARFSDDDEEATNIRINKCIEEAIEYQISLGFKKIIIPHFYEDNYVAGITSTIKVINQYVKNHKKEGIEYFMTLPLAYDIIRNQDNVENLLLELTDMSIIFDGYFVVCENKPEQGHKISNDIKLIANLSQVLRVLKYQGFKTIYGYANWDAIFFLAQTDIDYITIGTYENLRNFSIKRFTEDTSGGASQGYYFSEKLLNMVRAKDLINIRANGMLDIIENEQNIFSDVILNKNYVWNIHKPDVNKNYLLSISSLLKKISKIANIKDRIIYVLFLIQEAIENYQILDDNYVVLQSEGRNYHLNIWLMYLLKIIQMKPGEFYTMYDSQKKRY
nr:hypothetical protein [uncultured Bacteroides sp.]